MSDLPRCAVGIDVETTSLDPQTGDIIDVAAIRYDLTTGQEIDRFEQLCQPRSAISSEIEALTGITAAMVEGKPFFPEIADALRTFIGTDYLFAHNASFDLAWLGHHGLPLTNPMWDTFPLATVAWPESPSYNLGMLAKDLALVVTAEHRAAADVEISWQLLQRIREQLSVSSEVLETVSQLLQVAHQTHYLALFTAKEGTVKSDHAASNDRIKGDIALPGTNSLPAASLEDYLGERGLLSQQLSGFTPREAQLQLAQLIAQAITAGTPALLEAGTGTGKTYGYLVPALVALPQHHPLIISTHTRHLQDQLVTTDIPRLLQAMQQTYTVALLKGRRNYLCHRRLAALIQRLTQPESKSGGLRVSTDQKKSPKATKNEQPALSSTESFFIIKVVMWAAQGGSDLERLNSSHQDQRLARFIHADALSCRLECGPTSPCPYQRARVAAQRADIIVVNHALLMQGGLGDEHLLQGAVVIIDEGHHLPAAARQAGRIDLSSARVGEIVAPWRQVTQGETGQKARHIAMECQALIDEYSALITSAGEFVRRHAERDRLLLTPGVRKSAEWGKLAQQGQGWLSRLSFVSGLVKTLLANVSPQARRLLDEALADGDRFSREFEEFTLGNSQRIQWIELQTVFGKPEEQRVFLHDLPLDISPQVASIVAASRSVIITSATLSTGGDFSYIERQLGINDWQKATLPTPFNYREQMLIYLVDDSPIPSSPKYDDYIALNIATISELLQGRTLGLFTSLKSVGAVYRLLIKKLNKANIKLFAQGITGGRSAMLQRFRVMDESVLLGTASFWEGVDIAGESLSCVVIPKLPFAPPDDPILTARSIAAGTNMFRDESVPEMILKIRQGVGRLIRSTSDQGVVVLFDSRLHRSEYGDAVIKSLPPGRVHVGSHRDLIPTIRRWFGEEKMSRWHGSTTTP